MVLRRNEYIFQISEVPPHICMYKHRLETYQYYVGVQSRFREANYVQWHNDSTSRRQRFNEMGSRTCQPVHILAGVVNGMKFPQQCVLVVPPMSDSLEEISNKYTGYELNPYWKTLDSGRYYLGLCPAKNIDMHYIGEEQKELY